MPAKLASFVLASVLAVATQAGDVLVEAGGAWRLRRRVSRVGADEADAPRK